MRFSSALQTLAVIGYRQNVAGLIKPQFAVVTLETMTGFCFFGRQANLASFFPNSRANGAGFVQQRRQRPAPANGVLHLMLRLANERNNRIVDANVHVVLLVQKK